MIEIDGSIGEGGGQVLRVCLALSALTRKPITIKNIRVNRTNPGLRSQHLTAIRAVAEVTAAKVSGLAIGSSKLVFSPGPIHGGTFHFDAKTAGALPSFCRHFCRSSHSPISVLLLLSSVGLTIHWRRKPIT